MNPTAMPSWYSEHGKVKQIERVYREEMPPFLWYHVPPGVTISPEDRRRFDEACFDHRPPSDAIELRPNGDGSHRLCLKDPSILWTSLVAGGVDLPLVAAGDPSDGRYIDFKNPQREQGVMQVSAA